MEGLRWGLVVLGLWLVSGTALSVSHHPHWYIRGWDFPRVLIVALALACGVAYRALSHIFLRSSGLLDPGVGRGLFNTYNAGNPVFRFPLDHVFHSNHFRLFRLRRLPKVGSDHFPVFIELNLEPDAPAGQPAPKADAGDARAAEEMVARQSGAGAR